MREAARDIDRRGEDGADHLLRSLRYLVGRYLARRSFMVARSRVYGMRFRFKTEDAVGRHIYKHGIYEPLTTRWLQQNIRLETGDIAIDVGANIGWFSVLLDKQASPGAQVFAFEPDPMNCRLLRENVLLNAATMVETLEIAVAEGDGSSLLHLYGTKNLGRHSLLSINVGPSIEVKTTSLDHFLERRALRPERVKLIKMDVEGYEAFVLRGMTRLLAQSPTLIAEFSPQTMRRSNLDPRQMLDLLDAYGFVPYTIEKSGLRISALDDLARLQDTIDLVWLKGNAKMGTQP